MAALERDYGIHDGLIPHRVWVKFYVRGYSPEDAAREAERSAYNVRQPPESLRKNR